MRAAIVGAGMAGLQAARRLAEAGCDVQIFEKARGPGGRMSTRRAEGTTFDHGAQYFTVRDERFRRQVEAWRTQGVVDRWDGRFVHLGSSGIEPEVHAPARFIGTPKMSAIGRDLLGKLPIELGVRIAEAHRRDERWVLRCDADYEYGSFDVLVVAVPPAQAVPLLALEPDLAAQAAGVRMWPCHALMLRFAQPLRAEFSGAFVDDERIAWIARNDSKPDRGGSACWVVHARAEWSEKQVEEPNEVVGLAMEEAFASLVGESLPQVEYRSTHRWLYARPARSIGAGYLLVPSTRLGVCGDWCLGDRVEDAFLSGDRLADALLEIA